uniref:AAA_12 domain-containing protein n=1 Tax=Rhabditophanes sp. KR3021 TaxID=114890 RepID=A0AC35U9F0_9BILA
MLGLAQTPTPCNNFVGCPKRVNLALSRAKNGLTIVGDEKLLPTSKTWARVLKMIGESNMIFNAKDHTTLYKS